MIDDVILQLRNQRNTAMDIVAERSAELNAVYAQISESAKSGDESAVVMVKTNQRLLAWYSSRYGDIDKDK